MFSSRSRVPGPRGHSAGVLGPKEVQLQGEWLQLGTFPIAVDDLGRDLMALQVESGISWKGRTVKRWNFSEMTQNLWFGADQMFNLDPNHSVQICSGPTSTSTSEAEWTGLGNAACWVDTSCHGFMRQNTGSNTANVKVMWFLALVLPWLKIIDSKKLDVCKNDLCQLVAHLSAMTKWPNGFKSPWWCSPQRMVP